MSGRDNNDNSAETRHEFSPQDRLGDFLHSEFGIPTEEARDKTTSMETEVTTRRTFNPRKNYADFLMSEFGG